MAQYLRVPETNIAGAVGTALGAITGTIVTTGHKALDVVELLLSTTQNQGLAIQTQIRAIQDKALSEAAVLQHELSQAANQAAGSAYEAFLQKTTKARAAVKKATGNTTVRVDISTAPLDAELQKAVRELLDRASQQVSALLEQHTKLVRQVSKQVDTVLGVVEKSLNVIIGAIKTLRVIINSLRALIIPIQATILIIKMIPLPQRYLIVSFTILESDLLELMTELVAQAKEQIDAIDRILAGIEAALTPLRDRIRRIRANLALFQASNLLLEASPSDLDILDQAGLYDKDSGKSLFDIIQNGQSNQSNWEPYGNPGRGGLNMTDPRIGNQLQLANPGDYIRYKSDTSGSYVEDYYKWSKERPPYPIGPPESEGWTRYPGEPTLDQKDWTLWSLRTLERGDGRIYGSPSGSWDVEEVRDWKELLDTIGKFKDFVTGKMSESGSRGWTYDPLRGWSYVEGILVLDEKNFDQKPGILKPSSWQALEAAALDRLRNLPLTPDFRDSLTNLWQSQAAEEAGTSTVVDDAVVYRAANGELYYLRVLEDEHSPRVAVRRYVQVKDESGTVIVEGNKTFSLNKESLITEMKIQLDQMTR